MMRRVLTDQLARVCCRRSLSLVVKIAEPPCRDNRSASDQTPRLSDEGCAVFAYRALRFCTALANERATKQL